jgi:hypothetical protein
MSHPVTSPATPPVSSRNLFRDHAVHGAVFRILHTPYGIRNSEIQNRKSGNPESWCGRVGQSKQSCSKRRYHPFRSPHTIQQSNAILGPFPLQQSLSSIHHHNHQHGYFAISGRVSKNRSRSGGRQSPRASRRLRFLTPLLEGV